MATGGRVSFNIDFSKFNSSLEVLMDRVERGTRIATTEAAEEILEQSLMEVPRETGALASTAFYDIIGSYRNFSAVIGYGRGEAVNARGEAVQNYMVAVHEDLQAIHPVGKAKFLEDPVRNYQLEAKAGAKISAFVGL